MPRMDGVEVLRRIKADPRTAAVPVIMLTTTDDPREIERRYQLGCSVYVTKPVEYSAFIEAIKRLGLFLQVVRVPYNGPDRPANEGGYMERPCASTLLIVEDDLGLARLQQRRLERAGYTVFTAASAEEAARRAAAGRHRFAHSRSKSARRRQRPGAISAS